jgi:hypothetical protein
MRGGMGRGMMGGGRDEGREGRGGGGEEGEDSQQGLSREGSRIYVTWWRILPPPLIFPPLPSSPSPPHCHPVHLSIVSGLLCCHVSRNSDQYFGKHSDSACMWQDMMARGIHIQDTPKLQQLSPHVTSIFEGGGGGGVICKTSLSNQNTLVLLCCSTLKCSSQNTSTMTELSYFLWTFLQIETQGPTMWYAGACCVAEPVEITNCAQGQEFVLPSSCTGPVYYS